MNRKLILTILGLLLVVCLGLALLGAVFSLFSWPAAGSDGFAAFCQQAGELTTVQWEKHFKELQGRRMTWTGKVIDVSAAGGQYSAWIDMDISAIDRNVQLAGLAQPVAEGLKPGQTITFAGDLDFFDHETCVTRLVNVAIK